MKTFREEIVVLEKFVPGGQVLATLSDGKKVFVWGALPNERAKIQIYQMKKSYAEAVATEILDKSKFRETPKDDCFLATSPWQILNYDYELAMKADLVREVFRQNDIELNNFANSSQTSRREPSSSRAGISVVQPEKNSRQLADFSLRETHAREDEGSQAAGETSQNDYQNSANNFLDSPIKSANDNEKVFAKNPENNFAKNPPIQTDFRDYFYRNKMEYSLWWDNEISQIQLAFHKRGSHQKIAIKNSSIERPEIFAEAQKIVAELNSRNDAARNYQSLLIRASQNGEVSSALFANNCPHPSMKNLHDKLLDREFSYSPNGFFQINLPVYEMALQEISRSLGDAEKIVDMYAGVGTIGLSVAAGRDLTLVETDKNAFREMTANVIASTAKQSSDNSRMDYFGDKSARGDEIFSYNNIRGICAKSENALEFISQNSAVILDPPRAGLDEKVVAKIIDVLPPRVIYLSCNPATQARDVAKLLAKYKISRNLAFNFFPHTPHIENLIILELK